MTTIAVHIDDNDVDKPYTVSMARNTLGELIKGEAKW
jgi:hypothetical protein